MRRPATTNSLCPCVAAAMVKETLDAIYATEDVHLDPAPMVLQALSLPSKSGSTPHCGQVHSVRWKTD